MLISTPCSAVVVPIQDAGSKHLFFLDSGWPHSFSPHLSALNAGHLPGVGDHWSGLPISRPTKRDRLALKCAQGALGIPLSGFLGWDFFAVAGRLTISVTHRTLTFGGAATGMTLNLERPWDQWPPRTSSVGAAQVSVIDTGLKYCLSRKPPIGSPHAPSRGWVLPTPSSEPLPVDLYAAVPMVVGGLQVSATVGWAPTLPYEFFLGQSLLASYRVTFDVANGLLGLARQKPQDVSPRDPVVFGPGLHHVGVQVVWRNGQAQVANVLPASPNRDKVKLGDVLTLPGVTLTGPEAANVLERALSSRGPGRVVVEVGGRKTQMDLAPLFT